MAKARPVTPLRDRTALAYAKRYDLPEGAIVSVRKRRSSSQVVAFSKGYPRAVWSYHNAGSLRFIGEDGRAN